MLPLIERAGSNEYSAVAHPGFGPPGAFGPGVLGFILVVVALAAIVAGVLCAAKPPTAES